MSDSSSVRVSLIEEVVAGTTPASPPMLVLPTSGQNLRPLVRYIESQLLSKERNLADLVRVEAGTSSGELPSELQHSISTEAMYKAMEATIASPAADAEVNYTLVAPDTVTSNVTLAPGAVAEIPEGGQFDRIFYDAATWGAILFKAHDVIRVETAGGDVLGYRVVAGIDGGGQNLYLEGVNAAVLPAIGDTLRRGERQDNGTTDRHFTIVVSRCDVDLHNIFRKQVFSSMAINIQVGAITTITFGVTGGATEQVSGVETPALSDIAITGATHTSPVARTVMDALNVPLLLIGGQEYEMTQIQINATLSAQARNKIGTIDAGSIRRGQFRVSGQYQMYKQTNNEMRAYINNNVRQFAAVQEDEVGNALTYSVPRVKYNDVEDPTTGPNTDDIETGRYTAIVAPDQPFTLRIQRFLPI